MSNEFSNREPKDLSGEKFAKSKYIPKTSDTAGIIDCINDAKRIAEESGADLVLNMDEIKCVLLYLLSAIWRIRAVISKNCRTADEYQCLYGHINEQFCLVSQPDNAILRLSVPCILPGSNVNWARSRNSVNDRVLYLTQSELYFEVKSALYAYFKEKPFPRVQGPFILIFNRLANRESCSQLRYCDNNNLETGAITNAISHVLGKSDNYKTMDFIYLTTPIQGPESKVECTLIQRDQLQNWVPYLTGK